MNFRILKEKSVEERECNNKVLSLFVDVKIILSRAKYTQKQISLKVTLRPEVSDWFCTTISLYFDFTAAGYCGLESKLKVVVILCFCQPHYTKAAHIP